MSRNHTRTIAAGLILLGGMLVLPLPASATAYCAVKKTRDGFVVLRSGPSASTRLVGRMTADDEVLLREGRKGDWVQVTWCRGSERVSRCYHKNAGRGWVNRKLIAEECD